MADNYLQKGSINKFKYNFDIGARSNLFHVDFFLPNALVSQNADREGANRPRDMGLRVEKCSLPSRTIDTKSYKIWGPTKPRVSGYDHDTTIDFTFLCDSSFYDRYIIEAWMQMIYASPNTTEFVNSSYPIFSYYNEYAQGSQIIIYQLRRDLDIEKPALKCTLYDTYPISYSAQALDKSASEGLMTFECQFAFADFTTEYTDAPPRSALNRGRAALDAIRQGSSVLGRFNDSARRFSDRLGRLDNTVGQVRDLIGG